MSNEPTYLYKLQAIRPEMLRDGPTSLEQATLTRHVEYLSELAQKGIVFLAGRTQISDSRAFGIVVFAADCEESARRIMQGDPAVKEGLMTAELYPFGVAFARWREDGH